MLYLPLILVFHCVVDFIYLSCERVKLRDDKFLSEGLDQQDNVSTNAPVRKAAMLIRRTSCFHYMRVWVWTTAASSLRSVRQMLSFDQHDAFCGQHCLLASSHTLLRSKHEDRATTFCRSKTWWELFLVWLSLQITWTLGHKVLNHPSSVDQKGTTTMQLNEIQYKPNTSCITLLSLLLTA